MAPHDAHHAATNVRRLPTPATTAPPHTKRPHLSLAPPPGTPGITHSTSGSIPDQPRTVTPVSGLGDTTTSRSTSPATSALRIAGEAVGHRTNVIVVGVDASLSSADAVNWAADACERRHATLRLVHAYPYSAVPIQRPGPTLADEQRAPDPQSAMLLDDVAAALRASHPNLTVDTRPLPGSPDDVLRHESERARLTVIGAHGTGHISGTNRRPTLGSVASALSAVNPAPVAIIHPHHITTGRGPVVVGVDGSPASEAAVAFAFQEAAVRQAELIAVHSWHSEQAGSAYPDFPTPNEITEIEDGEHALLSQRLAGWRETYPDVQVHRRVINGRSTPALLDFGQSAQLVAVGSRGRGYTSRLLGSTSNALILQCECPVVVASPLSCP
jgi:nucleotide-binding universal stress UspA family protein